MLFFRENFLDIAEKYAFNFALWYDHFPNCIWYGRYLRQTQLNILQILKLTIVSLFLLAWTQINASDPDVEKAVAIRGDDVNEEGIFN